jgi:hypothetical protein
VTQPGPDQISHGDEISQGMDQRSLWPRSWPRPHRPARPRRWIAAGSALVLAAAAAIGVVLTRPPYPHSWCGPVLAELHVPDQSDLAYAQVLARLRRRDHAPVRTLVADLRDYAIARSVLQYSDGLSSGSMAGMNSIFTAVKGDLRVLNRRCGQGKGAYEKDSF